MVVVLPVVVVGLVVVLSVVVVLVCANAKGAISAQAILTMVRFICVLPLVNLLGASMECTRCSLDCKRRGSIQSSVVKK